MAGECGLRGTPTLAEINGELSVLTFLWQKKVDAVIPRMPRDWRKSSGLSASMRETFA
jgi:hypothetical protein